MHNKTQQHSV